MAKSPRTKKAPSVVTNVSSEVELSPPDLLEGLDELKDSDLSYDKLDRIEDMVFNAMSMRQKMFSRLSDPRRDIDAECGYPPSIDIEDYKKYYGRDPIASRVVQVLPQESFSTQPLVYETEDVNVLTPFEETWVKMLTQLRGEDSYYNDESANYVWDVLMRADEASGIGHYGGILLGIDDGRSLAEPATLYTKGQERPEKNRQIRFMQVFDEETMEVIELEENRKNKRFGMPTKYKLTFDNERLRDSINGVTSSVEGSAEVHWTRVIHLADNTLTNDLMGVPRMRPVFNNILNLYKLSGGSAEMYWQGALPGLSFETHPNVQNPRIDKVEMKKNIENFFNGLQRYIVPVNMQAKSLAPQVVDPTPQMQAQIDLICIKLGVPKRIFMGSERGELASTQDSETWNKRLMRRQTMYITPRIIAPFLNRLIALNVLAEPMSGYRIAWPLMNTLNSVQKADVAFKITQALAMYAQSDSESIIRPDIFMSKVLGFTEQEAAEIIESTRETPDEERMTADPQQQAEEQLKLDQQAAKNAEATLLAKSQDPNNPGNPNNPGTAGKNTGKKTPSGTNSGRRGVSK